MCLIFATLIQHNFYSNLRYPNRFRRALLLFCNPMITESLDMTISLASTERETWKLFFVLLRLEIKTEILSWPSQWVSLICCTMNLETLPRLHGKSKYTIWSIKYFLKSSYYISLIGYVILYCKLDMNWYELMLSK